MDNTEAIIEVPVPQDDTVVVDTSAVAAATAGEGGPPEEDAAPNGAQTSRICDYFASPRGCVKGDRCDFLHVEGGKGSQESHAADADGTKLCDFYMTERGCVKEERCDFLHPKAPNGIVTKKVCQYFGTGRGCAKDMHCDFLHLNSAARAQAARIPMGSMQMAAMGNMGAPMYPTAGGFMAGQAGSAGVPGMRPGTNTTAQSTGNTRVCSFYQSPRGCAKQERCDFIHQGPAAQPIMSHQSMQPQVDPMADPAYAAYYQQQAAYAQQQGQAPVQSLYSYGAAPSSGYGAAPSSGYSEPAQINSSGQRVCSFFLTSRGCRKGDRCDFAHTSGDGEAPEAKPSVRYSPY